MNNSRKTSNAVRILHRRYVGEDAQRKASLEQERVNAEVARTIMNFANRRGSVKKSWRSGWIQRNPSSAASRTRTTTGIRYRC